MFRQILWYKFLFVKVIHFGGRRDSIFNLNNVWHHSRGFADSNISKSLENFILVMFYALTSPYLKKNNIERMRNSMWFRRENDENVVRTRDWCGWPSSPRLTLSCTALGLILVHDWLNFNISQKYDIIKCFFLPYLPGLSYISCLTHNHILDTQIKAS